MTEETKRRSELERRKKEIEDLQAQREQLQQKINELEKIMGVLEKRTKNVRTYPGESHWSKHRELEERLEEYERRLNDPDSNLSEKEKKQLANEYDETLLQLSKLSFEFRNSMKG